MFICYSKSTGQTEGRRDGKKRTVILSFGFFLSAGRAGALQATASLG
jgi:hypothetical protein